MGFLLKWISRPLSIVNAMLFNVKARIHYSLSQEDKKLIMNTRLFTTLTQPQWNEMLHRLHIRKYVDKKIIFREGEAGNALYIIKKGSVRIYTYNKTGNKIPLARLNEGNYFGEQDLLRTASKSRSANIETIKTSILIKINEKYISYALERDENLRQKLLRLGYAQSLSLLKSTTTINQEIKRFISTIKNQQVITLQKDEIIFNAGDAPDNIYIILRGSIELRIFDKSNETYHRSVISTGYLFGELGVIKNKARSATAVALCDTDLLMVKGEEFKKFLEKNRYLDQFLSSLEKIYQLPKMGYIEQNFGFIENLGATINNTYKLDDGRIVICSQLVDGQLFKMYTLNADSNKVYEYNKTEKNITLSLSDKYLTAITAFGYLENLPELCRILLTKQEVDKSALINFEKFGEINTINETEADKDIICVCMSVTRNQLQQLINQGINTFEGLRNATGASTSCGACGYKIKEMIGQQLWLPAFMQKMVDHNELIKSYVIRLGRGKFSDYRPGQYVIIQKMIDGHWIERLFTISEFIDNKSIRITIKHYLNGYLSNNLKKTPFDEFQINVTQPQGEFVINLDVKKEALCFAGGIGITPMMAFARNLAQQCMNKRCHITYYATTKNDFIYVDEFAELSKILSRFSIDYITTQHNKIDQKNITKILSSFKNPDIYICGPEGFVKHIKNILKKLNVSNKKIHVEKFVYAG